jgi:hypothetical protein
MFPFVAPARRADMVRGLKAAEGLAGRHDNRSIWEEWE